MQHLKNSIKSFEKVAIDQEYKGLEKYGQALNPLDDYCWLEMAQEEAVDLYKYLEAEKEKRKFVVDKIRSLLDDTSHVAAKLEIESLLDVLEGKNKRPVDETETS